MSTWASPRSTLVFLGWQFPMLPSRAVNIYIMVISEDPWHSHLLPSVWKWSCHYLFLRLLSVAGIRTPFRLRGERSNRLRHRGGCTCVFVHILQYNSQLFLQFRKANVCRKQVTLKMRPIVLMSLKQKSWMKNFVPFHG